MKSPWKREKKTNGEHRGCHRAVKSGPSRAFKRRLSELGLTDQLTVSCCQSKAEELTNVWRDGSVSTHVDIALAGSASVWAEVTAVEVVEN